jgi:hypothetical protein
MTRRLDGVEIELVEKYSSGAISKDEFLAAFPGELLFDRLLASSILEDALLSGDAGTADIGFVLMLIQSDLAGIAVNTEVLCKLLLEPWHFHHEDIAMVLKEMKDPATVNCLFEAAQLRLEYLEYDDTYQLARKCIKALSSIDTDKAREKLEDLTHSEVVPIQEYAQKVAAL